MKSSELVNRITTSRRGQESMVGFLKSRDEPLAIKLHECGSYLRIREWLNSGETRLLHARFCKQFLLCRCCAWRRSVRFVAAYAKRLQAVMTENPQLLAAHVVLTTVNGPDLSERLTAFKNGWSNMIRAAHRGKDAASRHKLIQWNHVQGSLRCIEMTNRGTGWHVHAHILALLSAYLDRELLSEQWQHFMGDESKIVWVTKCHGEPLAALCEVLKYAVKFSEVSPEQLLEAHYVCKASRLADPQGYLRRKPGEPIDPDIDQDDPEDIAALSGPYRDLIFRWFFPGSCFRMEEAPALPQPPPDSPRWSVTVPAFAESETDGTQVPGAARP